MIAFLRHLFAARQSQAGRSARPAPTVTRPDCPGPGRGHRRLGGYPAHRRVRLHGVHHRPGERADGHPPGGAMSNVIQLRPTPPTVTPAPAPVLDPPDADELNAARLYANGDLTMEAFVRCCSGCQIRAGRALDKHLGIR